jgi:hypothetical protein
VRIGIDFDNTIAAYDHVFLAVARQWLLLPEGFQGGKKAVRDAIRNGPGGERQWQRLQGYVYGKQMQRATLFPGVGDFLQQCREQQIPVYIISHKTAIAHFDQDRTNLRHAAWAWMEAKGFFREAGFAIDPSNVSFHDNRGEKLNKVKQSGCDVFIDDLEEIFLDPDFPPSVNRILFAPGDDAPQNKLFRVFSSWRDISNELFGCR